MRLRDAIERHVKQSSAFDSREGIGSTLLGIGNIPSGMFLAHLGHRTLGISPLATLPAATGITSILDYKRAKALGQAGLEAGPYGLKDVGHALARGVTGTAGATAASYLMAGGGRAVLSPRSLALNLGINTGAAFLRQLGSRLIQDSYAQPVLKGSQPGSMAKRPSASSGSGSMYAKRPGNSSTMSGAGTGGSARAQSMGSPLSNQGMSGILKQVSTQNRGLAAPLAPSASIPKVPQMRSPQAPSVPMMGQRPSAIAAPAMPKVPSLKSSEDKASAVNTKAIKKALQGILQSATASFSNAWKYPKPQTILEAGIDSVAIPAAAILPIPGLTAAYIAGKAGLRKAAPSLFYQPTLGDKLRYGYNRKLPAPVREFLDTGRDQMARDLRAVAKSVESHPKHSNPAGTIGSHLRAGLSRLTKTPRMYGSAFGGAKMGVGGVVEDAVLDHTILPQMMAQVGLTPSLMAPVTGALAARDAYRLARKVIKPKEIAHAWVNTPAAGEGREMARSIMTRPQVVVDKVHEAGLKGARFFDEWTTVAQQQDMRGLLNLGSEGLMSRVGDQIGSTVANSPAVHAATKALTRPKVASVEVSESWSPRATEGNISEHVGLFIPIPSHLAHQYRSKPQDPSPPHVTLLYFGKLDGRRIWTFIRICREVLEELSPFNITLSKIDHFPKGEDGVPWYSTCLVEDPVYDLRRRLVKRLRKEGFDPQGKGTNDWKPHATLAYLPEGQQYTGLPPQGSWKVHEVQIWGLPEVVSIELKVQGLKDAIRKASAPKPGLVSSLAGGLHAGLTAPLRMYPLTFATAGVSAGLYGAHTGLGQPAKRMSVDWAARQYQGQPYKELYRTFLRGSNALRPDQLALSRS